MKWLLNVELIINFFFTYEISGPFYNFIKTIAYPFPMFPILYFVCEFIKIRTNFKTKDCVDYAKEKIKTFLLSIKRVGCFKLTYKIESPINESGKREILFKKTLYFSTDFKYQLE